MTEVGTTTPRTGRTAGGLLALVRAGRASTRSELRQATGLSRTGVASRVDALLDAGLLRSGADVARTGGRPAGSLVFNTAAGTVLAVAIGRSRSQVAAFDLGADELTSSAVDHEVGASPDVVMPVVAAQLRALLTDDLPPVLGIGVSLPGTVDPVRGVSVNTPVMAGWDGVELAPYLADVADAPLFVAGDADALARSERHGGHARRFSDLLVVKASTGLGLGIVAEGRIVAGARGGAGDIGHTKVAVAEDRACRCGATGCLETVAAGWALVAELREQGRQVEHIRDLVALALGGDARAKQLLRESGRRLGEVLAVAINLLNPQVVVLGGDMPAAFDVYAAGVRETVYPLATVLATRDLQVLPATYGARAGLVGCAATAIGEVLRPDAVDARLRGR
jgi:predicted NBD/HSP70 family sugar kinase